MYFIARSDIKKDPAHCGALAADGRLQIHPAAFWAQFTQAEIGAFCARQGLYCIPTTELVAWLKDFIQGQHAIEIGAGTGILCDALGIPGTDNRMQARPEIKAHYLAIGQTPITYGNHVQHFEAEDAVRHFTPQVVVAAWVTHKWNEAEAWREGNFWGIDEAEIVRAATYVHIGNRHVHQHKPILDMEHTTLEEPWLFSRAMNGSPNIIQVWRHTPGGR